MSSSILKVEAITKSFATPTGPLRVLNEVSFTLDEGSTSAIVGPSGSGKTTLLGLCAGLDQPSSGRIWLDQHELSKGSEDERAQLRNKLVGFVFQNFQLIPTLTALENVMIPLELQANKQAQERARSMLDKVGLGKRLGHYPLQLSGGEQQRVAIARAFINTPRILFADEPTGNLDNDTAGSIIDSLFALNDTFGTALVLVTHDLELAQRTEKILRLKGGNLVSVEKGAGNKAALTF